MLIPVCLYCALYVPKMSFLNNSKMKWQIQGLNVIMKIAMALRL